MIKLYENGVYLLNGTEIVEDTGNVQREIPPTGTNRQTVL